MSLHKEIRFEDEICEHLGGQGWIFEAGVSAQYDRTRALFPGDVIAWVQESQPTAWQALEKAFGGKAHEVLLDRLRDQLSTRGTLDVLRSGIELHPVRGMLQMAQFRPASGMNPALTAKYRANRLRVVRQVRYSLGNENCLDLVLFLNGIPVATAELKSDFTQGIQDAVDQYRYDRDPAPKGQQAEPILSFPSGALVHFAVSNSEVMMATRLEGKKTRFLPFNKGNHGAAGNPPSATGHPTGYLWEEVWERESFLDILGRYLVTKKNEKRQIVSYLFPRYHQLAATRKLLAAVGSEGAGGKYLIQHSAGSGKTNSIAWTAHLLSELHDGEHRKVFDSVLVVSDRKVIDGQLQDAVFDLERTKGVVTSIKGEGGSKSGELAEALNGDKKIIVCTIQTFPALYEKMTELVRKSGRRFAVIADEAHSSQTGEAASKLKQVLSPEEIAELEEGGEISGEDILRAQMTSRSQQGTSAGITYVAFTATPKAKTMELFGRCPRPEEPAGPDNLPEAFHVYSMRQAIEEGFILDVLKNYTTYKLAFKLANDGKEYDEKQIERSAAMKGIMRWVRLHPYNISQKVQIVVEHFLENVQPLLSGHGKAMVVVGSRLEAVRWQLAMQKYIQSQQYPLSALVAFSGEVVDKESGEAPFSETSRLLNPNLRGRDIRDAFDTEEYQILLVANKFQTGFDQPLLCGMYVDRRLDGIQAVQTLSRLNRAYSGPFGVKDTTFILDFVNDGDDILKSFQTYYETATLEDVTDPNLIYNMRAKLDATGYYDEPEVDRVAAAELDPNSKQSDLVRALEPAADRLMRGFKAARQRWVEATDREDEHAASEAHGEMEALQLFKRDMASFSHAYTFLSQIFDYGNTALEKRAIFYKRLIPLLEFEREREGIDLSKVVLTHHTLRNAGQRALRLGGDSPTLQPLTDAGSGSVQEKEKALLQEIIAKVNDLFGADTTEGDRLVYVNNVIKGKLLESKTLVQQAANNTKEQFASSPDLMQEIVNAVMDAYSAHSSMSRQALESEKVRLGLKNVLLGPAQLYEGLRERAGARLTIPDSSAAPQSDSYSYLLANPQRQDGVQHSREPYPPNENGTTTVRIFFSTDRAEDTSGTGFLDYGAERSPGGKLHFGECEISIPKAHRVGELESPSIFRLEFKPNVKKHIVLLKTLNLEAQRFFQKVREAVSLSPAKDAFVFIHGYNVSFQDAARRTGQIAFDLKFAGAPIFYSWPSNHKVLSYPADEASIIWSTPHFQTFLELLAEHSEAERIHIIGHSMGNRAVCDALKALSDQSQDVLKFSQLILAAPDIDADTFRELAAALQAITGNITLYESSKDKAILASKKIHRNPRAGEPLLIIPGLDTIDASEVDTDFLSHSYFADSWPLLQDIYSIVADDKPPYLRFGLKKINHSAGEYFAFRA